MTQTKNTRRPSRVESSGAGVRDEELAALARGGCRDSFEELVRRFQVRLLRFLQRRVQSNADAEDLLQETFIRAYERLDRYDVNRPLGTWLFTIAHRLAISHHRRHQTALRASEVLMHQGAETETCEPSRQLADEEGRKLLWEKAAAVLSEEQLSAVWLFYVEEMPAPQIAEVMGRSWVSVKTILFRARRKLMPFLEDPRWAGCGAVLSGRRALVPA